MIPDPLLDDLHDRLAACDDDELCRLHDLFGRSPLEWSRAVGSYFEALKRACEGEWRRRRTGEGYRLDDVVDAVSGMSDDDVAEGLETYHLVRQNTGLPTAMLAVHEVCAQLITVERLQRGAMERRVKRAISECTVGWWGNPGGVPENPQGPGA